MHASLVASQRTHSYFIQHCQPCQACQPCHILHNSPRLRMLRPPLLVQLRLVSYHSMRCHSLRLSYFARRCSVSLVTASSEHIMQQCPISGQELISVAPLTMPRSTLSCSVKDSNGVVVLHVRGKTLTLHDTKSKAILSQQNNSAVTDNCETNSCPSSHSLRGYKGQPALHAKKEDIQHARQSRGY